LDEDRLLRETRKRGDLAVLGLPKWDRVITADFGPCEIKTFRVSRDGARPVVEMNLLEWTGE
jgi:alpha-mannosidase